MNDLDCAPNHHAHHAPFSGVTGLVAAFSMTVGRGGDAQLAAELSGVGPADVVVDIGCGPGVAARLAASRGATVTGIDPAAVMLRVARFTTRDASRIRYISGAAEALPVDDAFATIVWSLSTVHHWADIDAGLAEVRRVLRPGGTFVVIEHRSKPGASGLASHGWTDAQAEAFADRCRDAGFVDVRVATDDTHAKRPAVSVTARQSAP
jgi:ubiquinone/menaquinone biosynthesis C-methylase UbiE